MPSPKKVEPALWTDRITAAAAAVISVVAVADLIRYIALGELIPVVTVLVLNCFFVLAAAAAWQGRMPYLLLFVTAGGVVVFVNTTYAAYAPFNLGFLIQAIAAGLAAVTGTGLCIWKKLAPRALPWKPAAVALLVLALFLGTWKGFTDTAKAAQGDARREIWAVPAQFDGQPSSQPGTVEELVYETKAYATDERDVTKRALVYLPYGYDESIQYNILYLMHGTGDDENYWLSTHESNKVMLDNMIAAGVIEPLIVVTPTFYVEEDCADDLDQLTWSFRSALRQDLITGPWPGCLVAPLPRCTPPFAAVWTISPGSAPSAAAARLRRSTARPSSLRPSGISPSGTSMSPAATSTLPWWDRFRTMPLSLR